MMRWGMAVRCGYSVALIAALAARAEEVAPEAALALPEFVVTATRGRADRRTLPAAAYRIPLRDGSAASLARSLPEALRETESVMVQKTGHGMASPYLRGFTGFRTLAMVDGIRLNHAAFRDGPNQYWQTIDAGSVDRYEVVLGPASVLYGSDAIGGAVNALPVEPPDWAGDMTWGGRGRLRYSSAEDSFGQRAELYGRPVESFGFIGGITWNEFGDLRGGRDVGRQPKTGYDERAGDVRVQWMPAPDTRLTLAHQSVRHENVWRTHRTIYGSTWKGLSRGDDIEHVFDHARDLTYVRLQTEHAGGWETSATVYRQVQSEDRRRTRSDGRRDEQGFEVTTWGGGLQTTASASTGRWTMGVEVDRDEVDSYAQALRGDGAVVAAPQGPIADDARVERLGLYLQHAFPPGAPVELISGVRYTRVGARADRVWDPNAESTFRLDERWNAVVGSVRGLVRPDAEGRSLFYAGVSQGFRAPNLSDLTRFDAARSQEQEIPVRTLDPERFLTVEIGARIQWDPVRFEASAYHTVIDGMIVRTPTGSTTADGLIEVTKRNAGDGYVHGVEGRMDLDLAPGWMAWAQASWMNGRVDGYPTSAANREREPVSRLMPLTGRMGLRWTEPNDRVWIEIVGEAAEKADRLSSSDRRDTQRIPEGGTPGYAVGHVRAGGAVTRSLRLTAAIENIFNTDYRIHGSGVNEPGRNLVVAAELAF